MMNAPFDRPLLPRDFLLGKRPYSDAAKLFLPNAQFELIPVEYLPDSIWRNSRRRLKQTHFDNEVSLISLVIPFAEPGPPKDGPQGPFELIWLWGTEGQTIAYANTAEEALRQHQEWVTRYKTEYHLSETMTQ